MQAKLTVSAGTSVFLLKKATFDDLAASDTEQAIGLMNLCLHFLGQSSYPLLGLVI
jgi:hypothetical protein